MYFAEEDEPESATRLPISDAEQLWRQIRRVCEDYRVAERVEDDRRHAAWLLARGGREEGQE